MTSANMPTRLAMNVPFASGSGAALTPISTSTSTDDVNYTNGFGAKYAAPASGGGRYVTRGEMNAIGNLASNDLFYHKAGGLNIFDIPFAQAIGGYPLGAVLDYWENGILYRVKSLKEDNLVNYLGVASTSGIPQVTAGSVDNTNWQIVTVEQEVEDTSNIMCSILFGGTWQRTSDSSTAYSDGGFVPYGTFQANKTGKIRAVDITTGINDTSTNDTDGGGENLFGVGLLYKNFGSTDPGSSSDIWPLIGNSETMPNFNNFIGLPGIVDTFVTINTLCMYKVNGSASEYVTTYKATSQVTSGDYIAICGMYCAPSSVNTPGAALRKTVCKSYTIPVRTINITIE